MGELKQESLDEVLDYAKRFGYTHLVAPLEELQKHQERERLQASEEYQLGRAAILAAIDTGVASVVYCSDDHAVEIGKAIISHQKKAEPTEWDDILEVPTDVQIIDKDDYIWRWNPNYNGWEYDYNQKDKNRQGDGPYWSLLGLRADLNAWAPFKKYEAQKNT